MNGLGQKLTGKNIRSFGQKMIGNVKNFGNKAMSALSGVRSVVNTIKTPLLKVAETVAPEFGIPAEMIDKAYDYLNKGEAMYKKASDVTKIVQGIGDVPGLKNTCNNPMNIKINKKIK